MWQAWLKQGLGESIPVKGGSRFKRSFDLEAFGIQIPNTEKADTDRLIRMAKMKQKEEITGV